MARSRNNRQKSRRNSKQKGGRVAMPIQYFDPSAKTPQYYPRGSEILSQEFDSSYGKINAVSTTQPDSCLNNMGPNLAPFSPYNKLTGTQTGGSSAFKQITNPLTGRKVNINSRLGQQILNEYIKRIN